LASELWFAFRGDRMLVRNGEGSGRPAGNPAALGLGVLFEEEIGVLDGRRCFAAEVEGEEPAGFSFQDLRSLFGVLDETFFMMAGRAIQIITWNAMHHFCGRCGTRTDRELETEGFSRICPKCGALYFPRLNPAAIVLVHRADQVLLARAPQFPKGMYSTLAGFVEPGETVEQTVAREVREEVGVEVKNITYFGSQPWPFPNSLMVAFTAEWATGELRIEPPEVEDADWYTADYLPRLPPKISIARAMIDDFIKRRGLDPEDLERSESGSRKD
jgi:NAD+ diphosphatase